MRSGHRALLPAVVVALLVVPSSALAATFTARVMRVSSFAVVLRRADGRVLRFAADQVTRVASNLSASGDRLAHMAGGPPSVVRGLQRLAPGILVRVTDTAGAGGRTSVALGLPRTAGLAKHAHGVVSSVFAGSFLLDAAGGLELRLRGRVSGLHVCDTASVAYHQDHLTLVADSVRDTGRASCSR